MDYRKDFNSRILKDYFQPKNFLKIFYKPHRIPYIAKTFYQQVKTFYSDIKFKPIEPEYVINVYQKSVAGLSALSANVSAKKLPVKTLKDVLEPKIFSDPFSVKLGDLFKHYGSDKSTTHDYYFLYSSILYNKTETPLNILEVGLGTNNIDVLSNMGVEGKPGASLRAFRDICTKANVYGADIDKRILFTEDRIQTFFIDQTQPETFQDLKSQLKDIKFDMIIDDGLHNSQANINTLNFALDLLKEDGVFIIEDVSIDDYDFHQIIAAVLKEKYTLDFIQTKSTCLSMIKKR